MRYYVPSDTARVLATHEKECYNLRLLLSRYLSEETVSNPNVEGEKNQKWRDKWLKETLSRFDKSDAKLLKPLIEAEVARWAAMTDGAEQFELMNATRLIVGLGGKGALEFGITLSHVTGLPFIPASALKGAARAYGFYRLAEHFRIPPEAKDLEKFEGELFDNKLREQYRSNPEVDLFCKAFGSQSEAGWCRFFDGVLSGWHSQRLFTLDVMTPHFPEYYRGEGKSAPHDSDNPNPVSFVTVTERNLWAFAVGLRVGVMGEERAQEVQKYARKCLRSALEDMGIGSKTSSGYGYFVKQQ
jgi:CRISPR-associated protein Cmr6